jgi:uncharacterized protein (DUF4213/DUF364 family)
VSAIDKLLEGLRADAPVRQVVVGAFWTAVVLETEPPMCGLASSMHSGHNHSHDGAKVRRPGHLQEKTARELAEMLRSSSELEAAIGMAAYNALNEVDETACVQVNAEDVIVERGSDRRVAVVGHFPFVGRIRREAEQCWILELNAGPGEEPSERAADILPLADVVALSGTTLLNHSFDELVSWCRRDAFVVLLGASAPLTPVLFECGVDAVSGTRVVDVEAAVLAVGQGATFRQIPGRRLLTMMKGG